MTNFEEEVIEQEVPAANLARGDTKAIFASFLTELAPLREQAKDLIVASLVQTKEKQMTKARGLRLMVRNIRIMVENKRKDMVADYKKRAGEIDTQARGLRQACEMLEGKLEDIEKFAEREEEQKRIAVADSRKKALAEIGVVDSSAYNLETMSELTFAELASGLVLAAEKKRKEAQELADKAARDKAQLDKALAETERLRDQAVKYQAAQRAVADKAEAERRRVEADHQRALQAERDKAGAKLAAAMREKQAIELATPAMREALRKILAIPLRVVPERGDEAVHAALEYNEALALCQEIAKAGLNDVPVVEFEEEAQ